MRRIISIVVLAVALRAAAAEKVNLLAMGDWGSGGAGQKQVATTLAKYAGGSDRKFNAMLLLGDNFYVRLKGTSDPLWETMFEKMYDAKKLKFPFYAVFGNHDYTNENSQFELDYSTEHPKTRWHMPGKFYRLDFPQDKPIVSVLMLDSNIDPAKPLMSPAEVDAEMSWLKEQLSKPRSGWMICCAHHMMFSNGDHGDNGVLQNTWGPLFRKYKVDFYVCGHDHDLQHLEIPGWEQSFILAGGGGASTRPMRVDRRGPFSRSITGFADFEIDEKRAVVRMVSKEDEIIHEFERSREGAVQILRTTASDAATTRTVKSITRGGEEAATKPSR